MAHITTTTTTTIKKNSSRQRGQTSIARRCENFDNPLHFLGYLNQSKKPVSTEYFNFKVCGITLNTVMRQSIFFNI